MGEVTIVESSPEAVTVTPEATLATNENDVAIVAIEAEKEIEIAQIEADARVAVEESYNEAKVEVAATESEKDNELWTAINRLALGMEAIQTQLTTLTTMEVLGQTPTSLETEAEAIAEAVAEEMNLTPQSTSDETNLTPMEATAESAEESLVVPLVEIGQKPVIKLV